MNLQDAIIHAREKAEELCNCDCGLEHKQLAEWLEELQELRLEKYDINFDDNYYYIDEYGMIIEEIWEGVSYDENLLEFGNIFKTKEEAEKMSKEIKQLLKGEK